MKKALVVVFNKFEEIEGIAPIDILRRSRVDVTCASVGKSREVVGRSGITVLADTTLDSVKGENFDAVVLPGGPGVYDIIDNRLLLDILNGHRSRGAVLAAVCAAPLVLERIGILDGSLKCTGHTSILSKLKNCDRRASVVDDSFVITSRGAGTALEFALEIAKKVVGEKISNEVAKSICFFR